MPNTKYIRIASVVAVCLALLVLPVSELYAKSSVWKISKEGGHLFLVGSLPVLGQSDIPPPAEFNGAYDASDLVVFETDLTAMPDPDAISYGEGTSIRDHLVPKTIEALESHLKQRGNNLDELAMMKPSMLSLILLWIELKAIGVNATIVELFYLEKAQTDGKAILALENTEEQLELLATIDSNFPDTLLEYTLRSIVNLETEVELTVNAWREGNTSAMNDQLVITLAQEYPKLHQHLITNRIRIWLSKLEHYVKTDNTEFVMVSAVNLVGDMGLLNLLEADGFTVEQL